jgi:alanine racemase
MNRNQISIHLNAIRNNYQLLQKWAGPEVCLMAVIKSDAYGHGMVPVATALVEAGCNQFAVFDVSEGLTLRECGFGQPILILKGVDLINLERIVEQDLICTLYQKDMAQYLSQAARKHNKQAKVQIKVDSGMNRLGIYPSDLDNFMSAIQQLPGLQIDGFMSHFAVADQPNDTYTKRQMDIFNEVIAPYAHLTNHIANSGGITDRKGINFPIARVGIALYGSSPQWSFAKQLLPAMSFQSEIIYVKTVPSGETISYGRTYKTKKATRVATIPVGYADGYNRMFSNKSSVLIQGKRAPVIGRVCMNLIMVDISNIDNISHGEPVVLLGKQDDDCITADELASYANTISYEIMCSFGAANHRIYCQ